MIPPFRFDFLKAALISLTGMFFLIYGIGMAAVWLIIDASRDLPDTAGLRERNRPISVQILDRNGADIAVRGAAHAAPVRADTLNPAVKAAVLSVEDRRFYDHVGVDPIGLIRAAVINRRAGRVVQGGSTLTQQLAKNVFLTSERTLTRKIQESLLALWLERHFSKDEILEKYLNRVYFGGGTWGLEAASDYYFGKPTAALSLPESALLAGLLKAPSAYNPLANPNNAAERTAVVLSAMETAGRISTEQRRAALMTPLRIQNQRSEDHTGWYVDWMWKELERLIGPPRTDLVVRTGLDMNAQNAAAKAVASHIDPDRGASQAALVTLDGDGAVRAMIGGASYADSPFNRSVQAKRQPGSAFKPFVYLSAFNAGLTPWDVRIDAPIIVDGWSPKNFKKAFRGAMSLDAAFAASINTVAVVLAEETGRERLTETASAFGLDGLKPFPSLALGAQDVSPLDLTEAYLPFANFGDRAEPYAVLSVSTTDGTPVWERSAPERQKVMTLKEQGHMNYIMKRTVDAGTGRRARLAGRDVGGKTGTTNDYRDAWFMGYVPDLVTGVWVGADDFTPMKRVTGGTLPAMIWHDMMAEYLGDRPTGTLAMSYPPVRATEQKSLDLLLDDIETALPDQ